MTFDFPSLPTDKDSVARDLERSGRNTWFLFAKHIQVTGTEKGNAPKDKMVTVLNSKKDENSPYNYDFKLPGFSSTFNMAKPIIPGARSFWYEALHFDINTKRFRPPEDRVVVNNIIKLTKAIEKEARPYIAKYYNVDIEEVGIGFNSWYRDPATNARVGGASRSRHLWGDAIDFVIYIKGKAISPYQINKVMESYVKSNGGLASASCFTHWDLRGFYARWSYGF